MNAHAYCEQDKLFITGELNFVSVVKLWEQVLPLLQSLHALCFDFSKVTVANSAAMALLIEWFKYAKRENKTISFVNIPPQMMAMVSMAGVGELLSS